MSDSNAAAGVVGILGGMGPLATIDFMRKMLQATPAATDQEHVPVVVSSIDRRLACDYCFSTARPFRYSPSGNISVVGWSGAPSSRARIDRIGRRAARAVGGVAGRADVGRQFLALGKVHLGGRHRLVGREHGQRQRGSQEGGGGEGDRGLHLGRP